MIGGTGMSVLKKYCVLFDKTWRAASKRKKVLIFLLIYLALFSVTFCLSYSPFIVEGKSFIWNPDGRRQDFPTLVYVGRYWRNYLLSLSRGVFALPLFDLNIGLGENIVSALNWGGFTDPINLIAIFFPTNRMEYLYNFLVILRVFLAGLTFAVLCMCYKKSLKYAILGSLIYAFSGFSVFSAIRHVQFINPMIQFPLLLIGIDQVLEKRKSYLFIFTVFYTALCGFYFLYMMTIAIGIYAIIAFVYRKNGKNFISFCKAVICIATNYILGIALAGTVLFPLLYGYFTSVRSNSSILRNFLSYGNMVSYLNRALKMIAPPASWDMLAMAAITLLALVALLGDSSGKYKGLKLCLLVAVAFYIFPLGGYIMNGFGYPSNRWTFIFAFLLAYITVEMMPKLLQMELKDKTLCFFVTTVYLILATFIQPFRKTNYIFLGATMLAFSLLYLLACEKHTEKNNLYIRCCEICICVILVIFNVSANAIYLFADDKSNYINGFQKIGFETEHLEKRLERYAEPYVLDDPGNAGRVDSTNSYYNTGMVWRIPTLIYNWSIIQENTAEYWTKLEGLGQWALSSLSGSDQRTIANNLLSVRYQIEKEGREEYLPYGYQLLKQLEEDEGKINVYKNQFFLPWGYTYEKYSTYDTAIGLNGLEVQETMIREILLEKSIDGWEEEKIESPIYSIPYKLIEEGSVEWRNNELTVNKDNGSIVLEFEAPKRTEMYLRLVGLDINESGKSNFYISVSCSKVKKSALATSTLYNWYYGRNNYLFNLGYSDNERTTCTITFPEKGIFKLEDIELYAQPMDQYPAQVEELRKEPLENVVFSPNKITGTIDLSANKILCLSVPYSKGWSAKVDGKPVEILKGNYMFMALPLNAGYHEIEFTYWSPGLTLGIISTVFGVGTLIYMLMIDKRKNKQQKIKE